jgi:hypothetical protein
MLLLLATTYFAFAQGAPDPGNGKGLVPCNGPDCNWCSLIQLIQNLINYAIYLGVLMGALVFAYAGWSYMTMKSQFIGGYSGEGVEYAKKLLWGVVIGMMCILGGWLVIDTLLKALVDDAKFGVWNKIDCQIQTNTTEAGSNYSLPTNARRGPNQGRYDAFGDYSDF